MRAAKRSDRVFETLRPREVANATGGGDDDELRVGGCCWNCRATISGEWRVQPQTSSVGTRMRASCGEVQIRRHPQQDVPLVAARSQRSHRGARWTAAAPAGEEAGEGGIELLGRRLQRSVQPSDAAPALLLGERAAPTGVVADEHQAATTSVRLRCSCWRPSRPTTVRPRGQGRADRLDHRREAVGVVVDGEVRSARQTSARAALARPTAPQPARSRSPGRGSADESPNPTNCRACIGPSLRVMRRGGGIGRHAGAESTAAMRSRGVSLLEWRS